ncbi:sensor histidine kinase [Actinomadura geliboluensis]|uniref:sensor histidine kinase n=1 Tax=Actinomadura geliboluensis TaxID=882440 RepID=UPI00371CDA9E
MALTATRQVVVFICVMCATRVLFQMGAAGAGPAIVCGVVAAAALQVPISLPGRRRLSAVLLPVQAVLNYLPLLVEAEGWRAGGSGFVAASTLIVVRGPSAWVLLGLIAGAEGALAYALGHPPALVFYAVIAPVNIGLMLYGLSRLADLLDEVRRERAALAARAGEVERLRLWRHVRLTVAGSVTHVGELAQRARREEAEAMRSTVAAAVAIARTALERVRSLPEPEDAIPVPAGERDERIVRSAAPILAAAHVLFIGQALVNFAARDGSADVGYLVLMPVTFALQFWHLAVLGTGRRPRWLPWTLAAQAATIYAPLAAGETSGLTVSGFFAGVVLLGAGARAAWPLCVAVCAVVAVDGWFAEGMLLACYQFSVALATAVAVYGLTRLVGLITELRQTRAELVETAALRERLRVGRDVHDLLGRGLTAIVLQGELTLRLLAADPARAADRREQMAEAARAALADITALGDPDARPSLDAEVDSARAVLESAGTSVRVEAVPVPGRAGPVLALVLREAVTNVLRHGTPDGCEVEIAVADGRVRLRVANGGAVPASGGPGTGLWSLRARLADIGGELTAARTGDRFEIVARAPVDGEDLTRER